MNTVVIKNTTSRTIAEDMFGLFFEDINYGLDGGLHAEMLENRNFEACFTYGGNYEYHSIFDGSYGWSSYGESGRGETLEMDAETPLNEVNPHYLVFRSVDEKSAFKNKAYDGLYLVPGVAYAVSFYAMRKEGQADVTISVAKDGVIYASETVALAPTEDGWKKYECTISVEKAVERADFVVGLTEKAAVAFDQFSMIPSDAVCGVFRKDLVEKLEGLKPSFIRFPGGCVIEGNNLDNRYQWKKSIGKPEERKFNWNRWAVHDVKECNGYSGMYAHYGQTLGVGYYEYFLLCEYLKAQPLPVLSVGLACQFMSKEKVDIHSEEMKEYVQDALDLIEFANGSTDTTWGRVRAELGHPEPFQMKYIGIGNEQWQTEEADFFERAVLFEKCIHEVYPEIQIIGSAGPDVSSEKYTDAWKFIHEQTKENSNFVYAVDEHYYVRPEWLYENTHFYDEYDRKVKVFAGEYACHLPGRAGKMNCPEANTLGAALAEAAFLTGVERNSDVVVLASYAPLFARMGYTQWSPDLIWFDGKDPYGTPSYYVQQMFSCNRGVRTLETVWTKEQEEQTKMYMNAVETAEGKVILKVVNASEKDQKLDVALEGVSLENVASYEVTELAGDKEDYNHITDQKKVVPQTYVTEEMPVIKANSFVVIVLQ